VFGGGGAENFNALPVLLHRFVGTEGLATEQTNGTHFTVADISALWPQLMVKFVTVHQTAQRGARS
jgi:hypothetical protein